MYRVTAAYVTTCIRYVTILSQFEFFTKWNTECVKAWLRPSVPVWQRIGDQTVCPILMKFSTGFFTKRCPARHTLLKGVNKCLPYSPNFLPDVGKIRYTCQCWGTVSFVKHHKVKAILLHPSKTILLVFPTAFFRFRYSRRPQKLTQ